jgi:DNA modification methylase
MKQNPLKERPIPAGLGKILLAHLIPDAKNPRKDLKKGDPEFEKINKSVEKFGQLDPIIFNTRTRKILGGHQRLKVLDSRGYTELYTVTLGAYTWAFAEADLKELSEKEENAANIALNKAQGDWDIEQLTINLQELKLDDMLEFTGFDDIEFDGMLRDLHKDDEPLDAEPQINRAEELRKEWGTELGQLWQCGSHLIVCGDCTDPAVVERVMQGEKADLLVTDPPYGIKRDKGFGGFGTPIARRRYEDNDWDSERPKKEAFDLILSQSVNALIFGGNFFADLIPPGRHWIVWDKLNTMPTFGDCELIWSNFPRTSVKKITLEYNGLIGKEKERHHPTQKPVALIVALLNEYSKDDQTVFDPFLGSGTTMIACENLGRKCRGCEISPEYVAVILQRYKDTFPGKEIKLIS